MTLRIVREVTGILDYMEYYRESALIKDEKHDWQRERLVWAIEKYKRDTGLIIKGRAIQERILENKLAMFDSGVTVNRAKVLDSIVRERINAKNIQ
jgi:hypothetical protein